MEPGHAGFRDGPGIGGEYGGPNRDQLTTKELMMLLLGRHRLRGISTVKSG